MHASFFLFFLQIGQIVKSVGRSIPFLCTASKLGASGMDPSRFLDENEELDHQSMN